MDDSGGEIRLTLWGEKATQPPAFPYEEHPIVAVKGVKISDYGGRSLGSSSSTSIVFNPNIPEALRLHNWRGQFSDGILPTGQSLSSSGAGGERVGGMDSMEKRKTISSIKEEVLGFGEKADYLTIKGN